MPRNNSKARKEERKESAKIRKDAFDASIKGRTKAFNDKQIAEAVIRNRRIAKEVAAIKAKRNG